MLRSNSLCSIKNKKTEKNDKYKSSFSLFRNLRDSVRPDFNRHPGRNLAPSVLYSSFSEFSQSAALLPERFVTGGDAPAIYFFGSLHTNGTLLQPSSWPYLVVPRTIGCSAYYWLFRPLLSCSAYYWLFRPLLVVSPSNNCTAFYYITLPAFLPLQISQTHRAFAIIFNCSRLAIFR